MSEWLSVRHRSTSSGTYVVRMGKKRGYGSYLTFDVVRLDSRFFWYYTQRQRRAERFKDEKRAHDAAAACMHVTCYRVVKLRRKP